MTIPRNSEKLSEVTASVRTAVKGIGFVKKQVADQISSLERILSHYEDLNNGISADIFYKPTISRSAAQNLQTFYIELHEQLTIIVGGLEDSIK